MPTEQVFSTIIVLSSHVETVRFLCEKIAGESANKMFKTGLSVTGNVPVTHYISSGYINEQMFELMGDPEAIVAASEGVISLNQITAILSNSDISQDDPFAAMDRLQLKMITDFES